MLEQYAPEIDGFDCNYCFRYKSYRITAYYDESEERPTLDNIPDWMRGYIDLEPSLEFRYDISVITPLFGGTMSELQK